MNTKYRKNVAILVLGQSGKVLACERADVSGAWQIPQGGIERNENPDKAAIRELKEEIGATPLRIVAQMPELVRYKWPEHLHRDGFVGQEQVYYLIEIDENKPLLLGPESNPEFKNYAWVSVKVLLSRLSGFKKAAYFQGIGYFLDSYPELFEIEPESK
jgi:putative (di)nucleoside polyphosphate hydrolase